MQSPRLVLSPIKTNQIKALYFVLFIFSRATLIFHVLTLASIPRELLLVRSSLNCLEEAMMEFSDFDGMGKSRGQQFVVLVGGALKWHLRLCYISWLWSCYGRYMEALAQRCAYRFGGERRSAGTYYSRLSLWTCVIWDLHFEDWQYLLRYTSNRRSGNTSRASGNPASQWELLMVDALAFVHNRGGDQRLGLHSRGERDG